MRCYICIEEPTKILDNYKQSTPQNTCLCWGIYDFLAPTGELYDLLCHRKKKRRKKRRKRTQQNECFCNNLDPIYRILLNPRNKLTEEFLTYRKIQDGRHSRHYGKLRNRSYILKSIQHRDPLFC